MLSSARHAPQWLDDRRAHGDASDHRAIDLSVVQEIAEIVRGRGDADLLRVAEWAGLAVPAGIEADELKARELSIEAWFQQREGLIDVAAEAVLPDDGYPLAFGTKMEL